MSAFDIAVAFVLKKEGGYTNNPTDPGAATNFGISQRAYPHIDIKSLTAADATAIYKKDYWAPIHGDELPAAIALLAFDCAVNQGVPTAIHLLQLAAKVTADGSIGPATIRAAQQSGVHIEFCALRAVRYAENPNIKEFGLGWMRRLFAAFDASADLG